MEAHRLHNNPPSPVETFTERVKAYAANLDAFTTITEANTSECADVIRFGGALAKEIEESRKSEKEPHLEAGRAVDAAYKPLADTTASVQAKLKKQLLAFQQEKERAAAIAAREAAEALRKAQEEEAKAEPEDDPFLAAMATPAPDVAVAAADLKAASEAVTASRKVETVSSGFRALSRRVKWSAKITDPVALATHYAAAGKIELMETLQKMADSDARHAKGSPLNLPGAEAVSEEVLA